LFLIFLEIWYTSGPSAADERGKVKTFIDLIVFRSRGLPDFSILA
jgi:hypothetical protein